MTGTSSPHKLSISHTSRTMGLIFKILSVYYTPLRWRKIPYATPVWRGVLIAFPHSIDIESLGMKERLRIVMAIFFLAGVITSSSRAQISERIAAYSKKEGITVPTFRQFVHDSLRPAARERIDLKHGEVVQEEGLPYRFGEEVPVQFTMENSGTWQVLSNGGRLWRFSVFSPEAKSIQLNYTKFHLPSGNTLHVYDKADKITLGAFTSRNNKGTADAPGGFAIQPIDANEVVLEYYEAPGNKTKAWMNLSGVVVSKVTFYEAITTLTAFDTGSCNRNVNCDEAKEWQLQKNGVVLIKAKENSYCSASIVNNIKNDGKFYLLTAEHCIVIKEEMEKEGMDTWLMRAAQSIVFWEFESEGCESGSGPDESTVNSKTSSGLRLITIGNANDLGGVSTVLGDFALFEVLESPLDIDPPIHPYFIGWDRTKEQGDHVFSVHHPRGSIKKISIENPYSIGQIFVQNSQEDIAYTPYLVKFLDGSVEPGSSGSPLFNSDGKQIGVLNTAAFCDRGQICSCEDSPQKREGKYVSMSDIFSKEPRWLFPERVADYLDVDQTNTQAIEGRDTCNLPLLFANEARYHQACAPNIIDFSSEMVDGVLRFAITLDQKSSELHWLVLPEDEEVHDSSVFTARRFKGLSVLDHKAYTLSLPSDVVIPFALENVALSKKGEVMRVHFLLKNQDTGYYARIQSFTLTPSTAPQLGKSPEKRKDTTQARDVVFPNPVGDHLFVRGTLTPARVRIQNLTGDEVLSSVYRPEGVVVSILPMGVYLLSIFFTNGTTRTLRIVKG